MIVRPLALPRQRGNGALAVAVVLVIVLAGCAAATTPATLPAPSGAPSVAPSSLMAVSATPDGTNPTSPPALTEIFSSDRYGISVSYPAGWTLREGSEPWTSQFLMFSEPIGDFIYEPTLDDHLFLGVASQPLEGGGDTWANAILDRLGQNCGTEPEPVTIDGAPGLIGRDCDVALAWTSGRGFVTWLYRSADEAWLADVFDRDWFREILATVKLDPEAAVDAAPSASP